MEMWTSINETSIGVIAGKVTSIGVIAARYGHLNNHNTNTLLLEQFVWKNSISTPFWYPTPPQIIIDRVPTAVH